MKCPYCGKEMEKGYIQSRDGLGWNPKKVPVAALSGMLSSYQLGCAPEAYRCEDCKKIIIDCPQD